MAVMLVTLPVVAGQEGRARNFEAEIRPHRDEMLELNRRADLRRWSVAYEEGPGGARLIHLFEADDLSKMVRPFTDSAYDRWWLGYLEEVCGLTRAMVEAARPGPTIFDWRADETATASAATASAAEVTESEAVRDALLTFYDRRSAGDASAFDRVISSDYTVHIGTAPGEWLEDLDRLRRGFSGFPLTLTPGQRPRAWAAGSTGWAADEPTMALEDVRIVTRLLAVFRHEDGGWRLVAAHFSAGVPDDEVTALQARWSAASS